MTIGYGAELPEPYEIGELADTEYRMLLALSVNAGRVLGHAELLQRAGGISWTRRPRLPREGLRADCRCNVVVDQSAPSAYFLPSAVAAATASRNALIPTLASGTKLVHTVAGFRPSTPCFRGQGE